MLDINKYVSVKYVLSFLLRPNDHSTEAFTNWEFMTTHCWGERAAGHWILEIRDSPSIKRDAQVHGANISL